MHDTQHISRVTESIQNWTQNDLIDLYFFFLGGAALVLGQKHLLMRVIRACVCVCAYIFSAI